MIYHTGIRKKKEHKIPSALCPLKNHLNYRRDFVKKKKKVFLNQPRKDASSIIVSLKFSIFFASTIFAAQILWSRTFTQDSPQAVVL
jgi:hypothetical protein